MSWYCMIHLNGVPDFEECADETSGSVDFLAVSRLGYVVGWYPQYRRSRQSTMDVQISLFRLTFRHCSASGRKGREMKNPGFLSDFSEKIHQKSDKNPGFFISPPFLPDAKQCLNFLSK